MHMQTHTHTHMHTCMQVSRQQDAMSRRILSQMFGTRLSLVIGAWRRWAHEEATRRQRLSEFNAARDEAEAAQSRLRDELLTSAATEEERNERKKEAMMRRLLKGNSQRQGALVLGAWRAYTQERTRARERETLEAELAAAEERTEALRLEESLIADTQKERIAAKVLADSQPSPRLTPPRRPRVPCRAHHPIPTLTLAHLTLPRV